MFKSIDYLRNDKDTNFYVYKLIDTEFECEVLSAEDKNEWEAASLEPVLEIVPAITAIALEYKKRNSSHEEIVKNLFEYNLHLCDKYKSDFEYMLNWQRAYLDAHFEDINFSKLYYQDLKDMWDKHKV